MDNILDFNAAVSRRQFFRRNGTGLGAAALASLLPSAASGLSNSKVPEHLQKLAPKAKRVIYLSMLGAPSQLDTFDPQAQASGTLCGGSNSLPRGPRSATHRNDLGAGQKASRPFHF